jgi:hypothetical protein
MRSTQVILTWGAGYLALELRNHFTGSPLLATEPAAVQKPAAVRNQTDGKKSPP